MTDAPPPPPDPTPPPPAGHGPDDPAATDDLVFETLWGRVLEAWEDDRPHNAVLDYALRAQKLPELAGRYRALVLQGDAQKTERANKRLDGIVLAATELMLSTKSPPLQKPPPAITLTAFAIAAALLALLAWQVFGPH